jgi:enoyl-CoA hydratase/3-hydroxyacyl-CoA dehydrogenase
MDISAFDDGCNATRSDLDDRGVLSVTLDRPDKLNAIDDAMQSELTGLFDGVDENEVRCVTVEGAGERAFCAGADIDAIADREPAEAIDVTPLFETVAEFPRPTLALVDGYCLGGGLELALACDLRVATSDAAFGFPEIDLGLIPGGGGTQRLVRLVGEGRAKELVFRGNRIEADRAARWGLVNRSVHPTQFDEVVAEYVSDLASGPPVALKVAKSVLNSAEETSLAAGLAMESQGFGFLTTTDDFAEGRRAFREERDPEFEGQ